MNIKEIALELSNKYMEDYRVWCKANPGKIFHGATMKAEALRKASFAESIEDLQAMVRCYDIEYKSMEDKVNGFRFAREAVKELLIKVESIK